MKKETINASDLRKRVERHRRGYRSGKLLGIVTTKVFDDYLKSIERDRGKEQDDATSP